MVNHVSWCSSSDSDEESFDYFKECSYHDIEPFDYGEEPFDNYEESSDDEEESSDEDDDYEHYDDEEASVLLDERVSVVQEKGTDIGKEKYFLEIQNQSKEIFDKQDKTVPKVYDYDHNTKYKSQMENCDLSSDSDNQNKNINALFQAILYNYFTKVSDLINVTGPNAKIQNTYPLILAVERRYITIIKLLLERKADVNVKNDCGDTALHCSVQPNELELCSLLLEHGADVNCPNDGNYTPVMLAAHRGYNNILKPLASREEADLTIRNLGGATALHLAISGSHFDCIETLLEVGGYPKTVIKQQDCPFFHAVDHEYDSVKILELLLQKLGPSIIANNEFEDKLVHHIILHNQIECLKILIKYGADINIRNKFSQTPLHLAVKMNTMDCVSLLVENKAYLELTDERELTPLHFGIYLFNRDNLNDQFFDCNKMKEIIICLAKAGAQIHTKNKYGKAPLDDCQDESLRKELLAVQAEMKPPKGWFEDNCYDEYWGYAHSGYSRYDEDQSSTPSDEIYFDVGDRVKVVEDKKTFTQIPNKSKELLGKKVKIIQKFLDNDYGVRYKKKTFMINKKNMVKHKSKPGKSDNEDPNSDALYQAIIQNDLTQVFALINLTGPNNKLKRSYPLILAVECGNENIIKFLLEKKAKVNVKNIQGSSALHCAVQENKLEICSLLLEHGAEVNSSDDSKYTPIMTAVHGGYNDILRLLASREEADLTIRHIHGYTALTQAILLSRFDCIETLLDVGGCPIITGNRQDDPFYIALDHEKNSAKLLEVLLKKLGSSIINNSECKEKLIHHVVKRGHVECLKMMIKYGADINIRNELSQTPLHLAVKINCLDCVKVLVENKADMALKDHRQLTPLHFGIYLLSKDNLKEMFSDYDEGHDEGYLREFEDYKYFHPKEMRKVLIYLTNIGANIYKKNKYGKSPIEGCTDESLKKELLAIQLKKDIPKTAKIASIGHKSIAGVKRPAGDLFEVHGTMEKICDRETCKVCNKKRRSFVFGCGHTACDTCVNDLSECRLCSFSFRVKIKMID